LRFKRALENLILLVIYYNMSQSRRVNYNLGGLTISQNGLLNATNSRVINVPDPVLDLDAANKEYVDSFWSYGDLKFSAVQADHHGWLLCDGRALNIEDYTELYNTIGTAFGNPGVGQFSLPDARGRVLGAKSGSHAIGQAIGSETHTMTISEMPSHSHTSNATGLAGQYGLIRRSASGESNTPINGDSGGSGTEPDVFSTPAALTINNNGSGTAFNIMQPTLFAGNTFILAKIL